MVKEIMFFFLFEWGDGVCKNRIMCVLLGLMLDWYFFFEC